MSTKTIVRTVFANQMHWVGDGLPVYQCIDTRSLGKVLNPFIMLDYGAPYSFKPARRPRGVGMHPHRGFETVTIAFQGEITHTDTTGASDTIHAGDVQWMTAGSGIEHSEMHSTEFTKSGGTLEMLQLWVNLPSRKKMSKPGYQAIVASKIPTSTVENVSVDVIAGEFNGVKGPAKTFTPLNLLSIKLKGGSYKFPIPEGWVAAVMVRRGEVNIAGMKFGERSLAALSRDGSNIEITATADAEFVLMAGQPIDEEYVSYGPMVMNTNKEITKAFQDYEQGKFRGTAVQRR